MVPFKLKLRNWKS